MVKLILIGLDGASYNLLEYWMKRGELPYLRELFQNGVSGKLSTTIPPNTAVVIPSICTGKNPGKIGISSFTKGQKLVTSRDLPKNTIWNLLSRNGYRSLIVNVPLTYPAREINGYMISDSRYVPSKDSDYVYPEELKELVHDYPIGNPERSVDNNGVYDADKELLSLSKFINKKFEITERIIDKDSNIDFIFLYINETDTLGHRIFKNQEHILSFYKEIDSRIRELVRKSGSRNIIVFSDHGFEKYPDYYFNINTWLKKEGYIKTSGGTLLQVITSKAYELMQRSSILKKTGIKIAKSMLTDQKGTKLPGVNWDATIAYSNSYGINLFSENISDETSYEDVRDEIMRKMREIKGIDGKKVIAEIYKREELYRGQFLNEFPDILFLTNGYYPNIVHYLKDIFQLVDEKEKMKGGGVLEGTHVTNLAFDPILIAYGEDIEKKKELKDVNIYDIVPTILHMFDLLIPGDVDGKVLIEMFNLSEVAMKRVNYEGIDERSKISKKAEELNRLKKI